MKSLLEDLERFAYRQLHSHYNHTKKGNKIHFTRIQYEHHMPLCNQLGVVGLPELQWVVNGKIKYRSTAKRMTLKMIKRFIAKSYFDTIFNHLYTSEWETMMRSYDLNIVYFGKDDGKNARALSHWTQFHHDDHKSFGFWRIDPADKHVADAMGIELEHLVLYRSTDSKLLPYGAPVYSGKMLRDWIFLHAFPPAPIMTEFHAQRFVEHQFPVFILWVKDTFKPATLNMIDEFEKAAGDLQDNQYLGLIAEIGPRHPVDEKLAKEMELRPKKDLPCVKFYNPVGSSKIRNDHEVFEQYTLRGTITKETIHAFMAGIKNRNADIRPDFLSQQGLTLNHNRLMQDMARSHRTDPAFAAMKRNYDLVILFYYSDDWNVNLCARALKEFNHAAEILIEKIESMPVNPETGGKDFPIRLLRYDLSKNSRKGLRLKLADAPILRMYRVHDQTAFIDHSYEADHPKDIIHFIYDNATQDLQIDSHIETTDFEKKDDGFTDM